MKNKKQKQKNPQHTTDAMKQPHKKVQRHSSHYWALILCFLVYVLYDEKFSKVHFAYRKKAIKSFAQYCGKY